MSSATSNIKFARSNNPFPANTQPNTANPTLSTPIQGQALRRNSGALKRVPSFLPEQARQNASAQYANALAQRNAALKDVQMKEEAERQRREADRTGEALRKALAAKASSQIASQNSIKLSKPLETRSTFQSQSGKPFVKATMTGLSSLDQGPDRINAMVHRVAALRSLAELEEAERLRRQNEGAEEAQKRALALQLSKNIAAELRSPNLKGVEEWSHHAKSDIAPSWLAVNQEPINVTAMVHRLAALRELEKMEEAERSFRLADVRGEARKAALAAKLSGLIAAELLAPHLKKTIRLEVLEDTSDAVTAALEHAGEATVKTARTIGNLALRAAYFFGHKVHEQAQILGAKAAINAEIYGPKAVEAGKIMGSAAIDKAAELGGEAVASAQILGGMAIDKTQNLTQKAAHGIIDGAQAAAVGAQKAAYGIAEGAQIAAQGAKQFGSDMIQGAKNALSASDELMDDFQLPLYFTSWAEFSAVEEKERLRRITSGDAVDRFLLALRTSALVRDAIEAEDENFTGSSEPRRFYGTTVLEEFERVRRILEASADRTSVRNAKKVANLIRDHRREKRDNPKYVNVLDVQMPQPQKATYIPAPIRAVEEVHIPAPQHVTLISQPQQSSTISTVIPPATAAYIAPQAQPTVISRQLPQAQSTPFIAPSASFVPTSAEALLQQSAAPRAAAQQQATGYSAPSRWTYVPPTQPGFLATGSYVPSQRAAPLSQRTWTSQASSQAWAPTPAAELLKQQAQALMPAQAARSAM